MSYIIKVNSKAYLTRITPSMGWSAYQGLALRMTQETARSVAGTLIQQGKRATVIEVLDNARGGE